jgi:hypothetical protein
MSQQLWATDSLGGYLANDQLSKKIRHAAQPLQKFRQFCDAEPGIGKSRGDKLMFNKISNISTAGGTISETSTIPKRSFVIRQGSLEVTEYAKNHWRIILNFLDNVCKFIHTAQFAV